MEIKTKIHKCDLIKLKSFAQQRKPSAKWEKKKQKTHRPGESIWKWCNWHGINIQNIQTAHAALCIKQTNKKKNEKVGKISK